MTLTARIEAFRLRLVTALPTGHGPIRERAGLLVGLDDGAHVGWGEASPLPGWSRDSLAVTGRSLRAALGSMRNDHDVDAVLGRLEARPHARGAVSGAWADLRARRAGLRLAASLSARWCGEVAVNAVVTAADPGTVESEAAAAVASGFRCLKLKVGAGDPVADVERIRAVRRGGPDLEIRLDANRAWDRVTAIETLSRAAEQGVAWCEEPTPHLGDFASIESATGVRMAADESLTTDADVIEALGSGITVVVLKPQALGGPDRTEAAATRAREAGATVVVTSFMDSAVGLAHAVHAASAFGDPIAHGLATGTLLAEDIGPVPCVDRGSIRLAAGAGIGFDPDTG